jgi:NAD(P)-dependent dehydrogenase (short-subunit alcohol dehydrogenase family)
MVNTTVNEYGQVDALFNNAGIRGVIAVPTTEIDEEDWDKVIDVNLKGVFLGSKHVIPEMVKCGGGVIVNTSSVLGIGGAPTAAAYCTSKAGVILLTKCLALEYATQNIRVNCICPGVIRTAGSEPQLAKISLESLPFQRAGKPDDIARAVLYLASDDSSYVTGHCLIVDGGWTAGPPVLYRA